MTETNMALIELLQKHDEGDFLRAVTEAVLQTLMEHDVDGMIGTGRYERGEGRQHRTKLHSTNPLERLNKEVKRRADVVGISPNEESIIRLIGAVLFEQNDGWQGQHLYMQVEAFSLIDAAQIDPLLSMSTQAP